MPGINQKEIDLTFTDAIQLLRNFMSRKIEAPLSEYDVMRIKAASTFIGNYPRIRASQAQVISVALDILKAAAENDAQLRQWVRLQIPASNVIYNLPDGFERNDKTVEQAQDRLNKQSGEFAAEREEWKKERDELKFHIMQLEEKKAEGSI